MKEDRDLDFFKKYFDERNPYLTIMFENGRILTRKKSQVANLKSIDIFMASDLPIHDITIINWDKVLCVRPATPIEIEAEKQREGKA